MARAEVVTERVVEVRAEVQLCIGVMFHIHVEVRAHHQMDSRGIDPDFPSKIEQTSSSREAANCLQLAG